MDKNKFKQDKNLEQEYINACRDNNLEKVKDILHGEYFKLYPKKQHFLNEGLVTACRTGFDVMCYLLSSPELPLKADIHENADRPLRLAFIQKDLKYVEYLCCSPELAEHSHYIKSHDEIPFLKACAEGTVEMVEFLLTSSKLKENVPIHIEDEYDNTGIFEACRNNRLDIVKYLLTSPDLKEKATITNKCATWAASKGYIDVVRYLCFSPDIEKRIDINEIGDSCLRSACERNNLNMFKFLIEECHLKMNSVRDWSASAFEYAAGRADRELFDYILYNIQYEPTKEEIEKVKNYSNHRGISVEESLEKRELLRNLEKDLVTNENKVKKPKI
jgi:ankyrin repeat protein